MTIREEDWAYLIASIGAAEKDTGAGTGKCGRLPGIAKATEGRDDALDGSLLAEAGLGQGHQGREDREFGIHCGETTTS